MNLKLKKVTLFPFQRFLKRDLQKNISDDFEKSYCLLTVAFAAGDGPTPPPEAVAMLVTETAVISSWVMT